MSALDVFTYADQQVRTLVIDGEPWFVLADVCSAIGVNNSRMVATRLADDEKGVSLIDTPGGRQNLTMVNESGMYVVVLRSDSPDAEPFRRWVTHEVLPAFRKTGQYGALAWIAAAGTLANLVTQDWSDALDGGTIAFLFWALADRSRDVNALMGGHR